MLSVDHLRHVEHLPDFLKNLGLVSLTDLHSVLHGHDDVLRPVFCTGLGALLSCSWRCGDGDGESRGDTTTCAKTTGRNVAARLTLQAVGVQQLLALLVNFDPAFCAAHSLPGDAPQQTLALVAVGGRGGRPHFKVVRCGAGDGVDQSLQGLFVDVVSLLEPNETKCQQSGEDSKGYTLRNI